MHIVNFTPHTLNMFVGDTQTEVIHSVASARCDEKRISIGNINGFPDEVVMFDTIKVFVKLGDGKFSEVGVNFPNAASDTVYVVSNIVAQALSSVYGRSADIRIPSNMVRDPSDGKIIGARGFARVE